MGMKSQGLGGNIPYFCNKLKCRIHFCMQIFFCNISNGWCTIHQIKSNFTRNPQNDKMIFTLKKENDTLSITWYTQGGFFDWSAIND